MAGPLARGSAVRRPFVASARRARRHGAVARRRAPRVGNPLRRADAVPGRAPDAGAPGGSLDRAGRASSRRICSRESVILLFGPALRLSALTTAASLAVVVAAGTPLAWWIATRPRRRVRWAGVARGPADRDSSCRHGDRPAGDLRARRPLRPSAGGGRGPRRLHGHGSGAGPDRRVGAVLRPSRRRRVPQGGRGHADRRPHLGPVAVGRVLSRRGSVGGPGVVAGAALSWARAMGEFGATLLFAGNLPGTTQTMPLAIYAALESDVRAAIALALVLAAAGGLLLLPLRLASAMRPARSPTPKRWRGARAGRSGRLPARRRAGGRRGPRRRGRPQRRRQDHLSARRLRGLPSCGRHRSIGDRTLFDSDKGIDQPPEDRRIGLPATGMRPLPAP